MGCPPVELGAYDAERARSGGREDDMTDERRRAITSTPRLGTDEVANRTFSSSFRGVAEAEVKAFLRRVADEIADGRRREAELEAALEQAEEAARTPRGLNEEELLDALGEETSRLLHTARDAARDIRTKAEENAARLLATAHEDSQRMRDEAEGLLALRAAEADTAASEIRQSAADAASELRSAAERDAEEERARTEAVSERARIASETEAEATVDSARIKGRELVDTARNLRERVLADLAHKRALLTEQIAELRAGRDRLLEAYRVVKRSFLDATDALAQVEGRAALSRPEPVDPGIVAAALAGEGEIAADDTAAALADAVDDVDPGSDLEPESDPTILEDDGRPLPDAGDLFARIRAQREHAPVEIPPSGTVGRRDDAPAPGAPPPDATGSDEGASSSSPGAGDDAPSARAATAIGALLPGALKRAKRVAQDEHNALLDALRRHKGRPAAASSLPEADAHAASWASELGGVVADAYDAGRLALGGDATSVPDDLAGALVTTVLEPVRARWTVAIDEAEEASDAIERVNARAREFRTQQLDAAVTDILAGAYARGAFDAAGDGATLQWVLAATGCSADCADNALEPTVKGHPFPTGHLHPPAYAGCRCSLTVAVIAVD